MILKIVSGGQTGADRAALDAALAAGVPCGGWCPRGRRAEDGPIPARYPMSELGSASYPPRTRRNVADSDGTLIVSFGSPDRGTALTLRCCQSDGKPTLVIDASKTPAETAAEQLSNFVARHGIKVLNVAGPRASKQPRIYAYVRRVVADFLASPMQLSPDNEAPVKGPETINKLQEKIEKAIAEVIAKIGPRRLPVKPSDRTLHLMAKAAVTVYEAAVENQLPEEF